MGDSKVLTIGGATQDIYLHYSGADCMQIMEASIQRNYMLFESGSKVEVDKILYSTGGGATNSAVSFKRLGFDVSCFCMVGDDQAGSSVLDELRKEGVDTDKIVVTKEHATGTSFVVNSPKGERTIFAHRGSNSFLKDEHVPLKSIEQAEQLYITSLSNESSQILGTIVQHAKKHNVPVAINPGKSQLSKGAKELKESLKYIDILILNSSEAKTFMGALVEGDERYKKVFECEAGTKSCSHEECNAESEPCLLRVPLLHGSLYFSTTNFFKEVMKMGPKIVVITDGPRGVYVATGTSVFYHPSLKVDVIDTLGAGDSFGSCFVGCVRRGMSVEEALRFGIMNSASVIGHIGAKPGLLSYSDLETKVKKMESALQSYEL